MTDVAAASTGRRVAGQGALLFAGYAIAQGCSFLRNAMLGHWLSKGDFGIAATITISLQLIEIITDLAADRLIIQAEDKDEARIMGTAHTINVLRGLLIGVALWFAAPFIAAFFHVKDAVWAFQAIALAPLIKGFVHLDCKRQQRKLDNRANVALEVFPQVFALAMTPIVVTLYPGYQGIVWLTVVAALVTVAVSHLYATRRWRADLDAEMLKRILAFGWPIWLSAFPLMAVFQGDRAIVGHFLGMEALAAYTAAFSVTMVPALVASKVGFSLVLPLLSEARSDAATFRRRVSLLSEATALLAAGYSIAFIIAGDHLLEIAFGKAYKGLGTLVSALAVMWAVRMLQAVPGTALMAIGQTKPYLTAGLIRASAIVLALAIALSGGDVVWIAASGTIGEILSFEYISWKLARVRDENDRPLISASGAFLAATLLATLLIDRYVAVTGFLAQVGVAFALFAGFAVIGLAILGDSRRLLAAYIRNRSARPALAREQAEYELNPRF
ncbi:MAG: oligosaccharide flippase family protein [Hyphomicrobiaceae bacterium]|nr:MAG: oligosaccharide flippase family protein [Hyphomicrobiaceae bacterium]